LFNGVRSASLGRSIRSIVSVPEVEKATIQTIEDEPTRRQSEAARESPTPGGDGLLVWVIIKPRNAVLENVPASSRTHEEMADLERKSGLCF